MSQTRFDAIEKELRSQFIDREDEIHGGVLATLSGQHILLIGPPGNAKTQLFSAYAGYLNTDDTDHFAWLLTKHTTPDEILGPVDIKQLKEGVFSRVVTHKLPMARTAFLDEIFKCNSAILNGILSILQERLFYNNGAPIACPLLFAAAASNELPDEDEGLSALYDRFLLRYNPTYIEDSEKFGKLLALGPPSRTVDTVDTLMLNKALTEVKALKFSAEALESITYLWSQAREEGLFVSDRRYKQMMRVMQAEAWTQGMSDVEADTLMVAEHILWSDPKDIRKVKQLVRRCVSPMAAKAEEMWDAAHEEIQEMASSEFADRDRLMQVAQQLDTMERQLQDMGESQRVKAVTERVSKAKAELMQKMLNPGASSRDMDRAVVNGKAVGPDSGPKA